MKILHKAAEGNWWAGETIKCKCGFEGLLEGSEDINNGQFMSIAAEIRFTCECSREIWLEPKD